MESQELLYQIEIPNSYITLLEVPMEVIENLIKGYGE